MSLIGSVMAGAAEGAAVTGQKIGLTAIEAQIREDAAQRLAEAQHGRNVAMERDVRQPFQRSEREATQSHQEGMQENQFFHAEEMQKAAHTFTAGENKAARELQERLHKETNAVARAHLGIAQAQLKLAQEQIQLIPQADGTFQKISRDGKPLGTLVDLRDQPIQGPKDIAASQQKLMDFYIQAAKGVEAELRTAMPEEKPALRAKMDFYEKAAERLAAGGKPGAAVAPGEVKPSEADVAQLKKNPGAAALFDQKFGAGASQAILKPPKADADKGPKAPAAPPQIPADFLDKEGRYVGPPSGPGPIEKTRGLITDALTGARESVEAARPAYLMERLSKGVATPSEIAEAKTLKLIK